MSSSTTDMTRFQSSKVNCCYHCQRVPSSTEEKLKRCAQCKEAMYCNPLCQQNDWSSHKITCKMIANHARIIQIDKEISKIDQEQDGLLTRAANIADVLIKTSNEMEPSIRKVDEMICETKRALDSGRLQEAIRITNLIETELSFEAQVNAQTECNLKKLYTQEEADEAQKFDEALRTILQVLGAMGITPSTK
jgi:hypothetical protein